MIPLYRLRSQTPRPPRRRSLWHRRGVAYALGLLVFVGVSGIPFFEYQAYRQAIAATESAKREAVADRLATLADLALKRHLEVLAYAAAYVAEEDPDSVERELVRAHRLLPGAISLNWIDEHRVIRLVVPQATNRGALGRTVGQSPAIVALLDEAERTGLPRATPLVPLFQGGEGFVAYFPIRRSGDFRGFINCVFDAQALLASIEWATRSDAAVTVSDGSRVLATIGAVDGDTVALTRQIPVLDRTWTIVARVPVSLGPPVRAASGVMLAGLVCGLVCAVLLVAALRQRARASDSADAQASIERLLGTVVQHMPGVIFQSQLSADGKRFRYNFLSGRVVDYFGCAPEDAYRDPMQVLAGVHPEDRADFESARRQADPPLDRPVSTEYRILRPEGVRWLRSTRWFRRDADGAIIADGLKMDVTEAKRIETELIQSRERLLEAQRAGRTGIIDDDFQSGVVTWSDTVFELRGVPHVRQFTREESLSFIHPDDLDGYIRDRNEAIARRADFVRDVRCLRPDGTVCWQHTIGHPRYDEAGTCTGMLFVVRDITDVREAQEALRLSEERHQLAIRGMREGLYDCDYRADVMWFSSHAHAILGLPDGALNGTRAKFAALIHPDDVAAYQAERRRIEAQRAPDGIIRARMRRSDGAWRWVVVRGLAIHDEAGLARSVGSIGDITEQHEAEEALRLSEQRYALLIEGNREGVFDRDFRRDRVWFSARAHEILGLPDGALNGAFAAVVPRFNPEDEQPLDIHHPGVERRERYIAATVRLRHADGSWRWITLRGCVLYADDGAPLRAVGSLGDITELKIAQTAAQTSEKLAALGRLTGGVAHDINNVLSVITLGLGSLSDSLDPNDESLGIVQSMTRAAAQGTRLANELLSFARRRQMDARPIDMNETVAEALSLFRPTVGARYRIVPRIEADHGTCKVDRALLETTLLNLLLNARDAMPDGGEIEIATETRDIAAGAIFVGGDAEPGRYVAVSVRDHGTGFPEAVIDRVFDPFFTTKGDKGGTGLGLSMVFGFVKQSNGHVSVRNADDGGAVIEMLFPTCAADASQEAARPAAGSARFAGTVLVVEDRADVRAMVCRICRKLGFDVREAASVDSAARVLAESPEIAVMVTDVVLGAGETGFDLARETLATRPGMRIVVMSGYSETPVPDDLTGHDVVFLQKPFQVTELEAALTGRHRTALAPALSS